MKLWRFILGIDGDEGIYRARDGLPDHPMYDRMFIRDLENETRSICNYLLREIRKLRFETAGFSQIAIKLCQQPDKGLFIDSSQNLLSYVFFDYDRYMALPKEREVLNEFFIEHILTGLEKIDAEYAIPFDAYIAAIDAFRAAGYVNEWVLKARTFRDHGIKCTMFASFDIKRFTLTLIVERKKSEIYREEVLRTKPHEIHFWKEVKDIKLVEGNLLLTEPIGDRQIWSKPLSDIL